MSEAMSDLDRLAICVRLRNVFLRPVRWYSQGRGKGALMRMMPATVHTTWRALS